MKLELLPPSVPDDRAPDALLRRARLRPGVRREALMRYLAALPPARRPYAVAMFSDPLPEAELIAAAGAELEFLLGPALFAELKDAVDHDDCDRVLALAQRVPVTREAYALRVLREAVEPRPVSLRRLT